MLFQELSAEKRSCFKTMSTGCHSNMATQLPSFFIYLYLMWFELFSAHLTRPFKLNYYGARLPCNHVATLSSTF